MASSLSATLPPSFLGAAAALACFSCTDVAVTPFVRSAATAAGRLSASISPFTALFPERPLYANTAIHDLLLRQRHPQHFLDGGDPLEDLDQPRLTQCLHAVPL